MVRVRAGRRGSPIGLVLAGILTAFLLGLIYLTQTIQVAATTYQTDQLVGQRQHLERQIQSMQGAIARFGAEPVIVERALQAGLDRLGGKVRFQAP